jgi:hypothetical protein
MDRTRAGPPGWRKLWALDGTTAPLLAILLSLALRPLRPRKGK